MRKGKIKRHRRRAIIRSAAWRLAAGAYDLAVDVWYVILGLVPVWGPIVTAVAVGAVIWLLGW